MPDSDYIFESGDPILVGGHGEHSFVFESGSAVDDSGESSLVFEGGTGIGGGDIGGGDPRVLEDWEEDRPFLDWEFPPPGNTNWEIVTDHVHEGTQAAYRGQGTGSTDVEAAYNGDVSDPESGDTFEWYHAHGGSGSGGVFIYWVGQSTDMDNCYRARFDIGNENLRVEKFNGGDPGKSDQSSTAATSSNTYYRNWIEHTDQGEITYRAEELDGTVLGSVSITDEDYDFGILGISAHGDTWTDLIQIL